MSLLTLEPKRPGNPGGTPQTLIRDPQVRKQMDARKQQRVLRWLREEIYSSSQLLGRLMGVASRQAVHKTLSRMEEAGLIKCGLVKTVEGRQALWGITEHGQGMAFDPGQNEMPATKVFELSTIRALRLRHVLTLQAMKLDILDGAWTGWKNCDRGVKLQSKADKLRHRPDALAIDPAGRLVAIELELTFKSLKRYAQEVLPSHARQICVEGQYQHVLWVCPAAPDVERMKSLVRRAMEQIGSQIKSQVDAYKKEFGVGPIFRVSDLEHWTREWVGTKEDRVKNIRDLLWQHFWEATRSHRDLESQATEEQKWLPVADHPIIKQTLADYQNAQREQQQAQEAQQLKERQDQERQQREAQARYAAQLAAQDEAQRRANSLAGKIGKVFGK